MFDSLGDSFQGAVDKLRGSSGTLTEDEVKPVVKEIQRALLEADASIDIVQDISDNIERRALDTEPSGGVTAREHVLNIVYEELVAVVGESTNLPLEEQVIILSGLQGAGKTTTAAKIAWWFSKKGLKPGVIQTDTMRPGAHEQLAQLAEQEDIAYHVNTDAENPVDVAQQGLSQTSDCDVRIIDTAGRHASEEQLIDEIQDIYTTVSPDRNLLVMDAAIGQTAKSQAIRFNEAIGVDGVVLTKMDGTAKGGGSLTAVNEADASIAFLGVGEDVKDIDRFNADGFISRLLGMGDLKQLNERVERAVHESADDDWSPEDVLTGEFTMYDMKKQFETMNQMGALTDVFDMIPGLGSNLMGQIDDDMLNMQEERMREFQVVMDSMTDKEMEDPEIIRDSRIQRIARGSGTSRDTVEELLQQFNQMQTFTEQMGSPEEMEQMAERMGGGGGGLLGGGDGLF